MGTRAFARHMGVGIPLAAGFALFLGPSKPLYASGTHFVAELHGGVAESSYVGGGVSEVVGLAVGPTFKLKRLPARWYVLAKVSTHRESRSGLHHGLEYALDLRDVDLTLALRTLVPVPGLSRIRAYGELGLGRRVTYEIVDRAADLGVLRDDRAEPVLLLALGLQARISRFVSVGVRGELAPLHVADSLAGYAVDARPERNRIAASFHLGFHL
ncbi:MAG: hypothetical protein IPK13_05630 [Deltaproteobacteria bacterium]|nr:hypothetical protein [Deltaproteobacteria bacterium]